MALQHPQHRLGVNVKYLDLALARPGAQQAAVLPPPAAEGRVLELGDTLVQLPGLGVVYLASCSSSSSLASLASNSPSLRLRPASCSLAASPTRSLPTASRLARQLPSLDRAEWRLLSFATLS